ncbi:MAG: LytR/AlgR family response regulator transcription factor [Bacteroidia bacterium]
MFNGIISLAMGFSFFLNKHLFPAKYVSADKNQQDLPIQKDELESAIELAAPITKVPVKKGESIILIPAHEIAYFEAFDNYSFLYDLEGKKMLCDYSLLFLEKRLDKNFLRVHRKHIVNTNHIKQIKPHLNSRYLIQFEQPKLDTITSSKSYSMIMRTLIKIE